MITNSLQAIALSGITTCIGLALGQIPVETELGEWSKLSVSGACILLSFWLVAKTIPNILATHSQANETLRSEISKGFGELKEATDKGNDRVASLLQSTLTQVFNDRREDRARRNGGQP